MKAIYILDGKKIKERDITLQHLKRGFLFGDGVFETLRTRNNKILMWDQHIKRLKKSCEICELEVPDDIGRIKRDIEVYLSQEKIKDAYIRINLWRETPDFFDPAGEHNSHILVIIRKYHPYPEKFYKEGIRCILSKKCFKNEKSPVVYIKSLNYLENILARMEAKKEGYDDAILLNTAGYISSATVSNLFFFKKGMVYTPSLDCGVLSGTVRGLVIEICKGVGIKLKEGRFALNDLKSAEEVFLTNTLMGVLPVKEIKGIFRGSDFQFSNFLREEVEKIKD